jgi:hypothetical protein
MGSGAVIYVPSFIKMGSVPTWASKRTDVNRVLVLSISLRQEVHKSELFLHFVIILMWFWFWLFFMLLWTNQPNELWKWYQPSVGKERISTNFHVLQVMLYRVSHHIIRKCRKCYHNHFLASQCQTTAMSIYHHNRTLATLLTSNSP